MICFSSILRERVKVIIGVRVRVIIGMISRVKGLSRVR